MSDAPTPLNLAASSDVPVWGAGFDGFFDSEYPRLVRLLYLVVDGTPAAEQLAQDAFAELVPRWRGVVTSERPDVWLRIVALRRATQRGRGQRLRRLLRWPGSGERSGPMAAQSRVGLLAAMATLSIRRRACVALHAVDGRSVAEIAEILGCRPTTASSQLSQARVVIAGSLGWSVVDPGLDAAIGDGLRAAATDVVPDVELARRSISLLEQEHDSRRRFRFAMAGAGVAVALLIVALLNRPWTRQQQHLDVVPTPVAVSGLYGLWRAVLPDTGRPVLLTLTPTKGGGGFTAYLPCGEVDGRLAVTSLGAFAAAVDGSAGRCSLAHGVPRAAGWLEHAVFVQPVGSGWTLVDVNGHPVATLRAAKIGAFPRSIDLQPIRELGYVPPLPADERAALDGVVTVPDGTTAAQASDLIGTWYPPDPSRAFLRFYTDGAYAASDGWHCSSGRWSMDPVGQLAFAPGRVVTGGCRNRGEQLENLPQWFSDADVVGRGSDQLRLYDDTGRLLRTVSPVEPAN